MKGIKYNIIPQFRNESIEKLGLPMKDLCDFMNNEMLNKYDMEIKITRNHIYNLIYRKDKVNKLLRHKFIIVKCVKD